jgi:uncharacterized damage-inducible protein DinB
MTRQDIQILFKFDRWANNRIFLAATVLTAEEFVRDLGGSFSSVRDVLVHIIGGEWIWISYWKQPPATLDSLAELLARRDVLFNTDTLTNLAMVQSAWAEVEREQIDFVDRITDELLQQALPFRGTQVQLAHLMQHMANHSTYHRGQVALMMRQLHTTPIATDFHEFLVARLREGTPKRGSSQ